MGESTMRFKRLEPGQGKTIGLSTIISLIMVTIAVITFSRTTGKDIFVGWVADAAAADIKSTVKAQVEETVTAQLSPVVAAQRLQLKGDIAALKRDITRMEYRRDRRIQWTEQDAIDLLDKQSQLEESLAALAAFDKAKGAQQ